LLFLCSKIFANLGNKTIELIPFPYTFPQLVFGGFTDTKNITSITLNAYFCKTIATSCFLWNSKMIFMKKSIVFSLLLLSSLSLSASFTDYFIERTMRIDFIHAGNENKEHYYIESIRQEPFWGGSQKNLIDTFKYGHYYFEVYDKSTNILIYSRGYSSLFGEWQTTNKAKNTQKSFFESIVFPFPKKEIVVIWYARNYQGEFEKQMTYEVDPKNYFINPSLEKPYPIYTALQSGEPKNKVDIVILPEGYTADEMELFKNDCNKFTQELFRFHPYSQFKNSFNIVGVLAPSAESGNDIPADSIWRNTQLNSRFYTFDSERYCMTEDYKSVRDLAANAPYDQIYILVNTEKYGGGAIYNFYNVSVNSNAKAGQIFIHELGHGFAGLADEYYTSSTSYNDFYNLNIEPWEPNISTLVNFDAKWKHLVDPSTPIPTPDTKKYKNKTGAFEGGGYVAKGIYRPKHDCLMKSFEDNNFCPACEEAIIKMIKFYTE